MLLQENILRTNYGIAQRREDNEFYEIVKSALQEHIYSVPYNSVSQFYDAFTTTKVNPRYGMSCIWQTDDLCKKILELTDCKITYYNDMRHMAAICEKDGCQYLVDPYLLHLTPIAIDKTHSVTTCTSLSEAFPLRQDLLDENSGSFLEVRKKGSMVKLCYFRFDPKISRHKLFRYFVLDLDNPVKNFPPDKALVEKLLFHAEQNNLSIRVVSKQDRQIRELVYPLSAESIANVSRHYLFARDNAGFVYTSDNQAGFRRMSQKISYQLAVQENEIIEFILEGVGLYVMNRTLVKGGQQ